MTQEEQILAHLERNGSITPFDALQEYGIMRLGARIFDLRQKGVEIRTELVTETNRYGVPFAYAKYTLKVHEGQQEELMPHHEE